MALLLQYCYTVMMQSCRTTIHTMHSSFRCPIPTPPRTVATLSTLEIAIIPQKPENAPNATTPLANPRDPEIHSELLANRPHPIGILPRSTRKSLVNHMWTSRNSPETPKTSRRAHIVRAIRSAKRKSFLCYFIVEFWNLNSLIDGIWRCCWFQRFCTVV